MLIKTLQDLLRSTYKIPGVLWEIGTSSVCNCQCAEDAIFTNGKTGWFYREVHILNIGFRVKHIPSPCTQSLTQVSVLRLCIGT